MSLQFIFGNSGSGKTTYLYKHIVEEASKNPFVNYLVIVPEQFTMQTQRQLVDLAPNHAIMNIDVLSFKRMAYRIFDELGINSVEILEETGKNLVLRKIAQEREEQLSVLRPNINRIGYISEVKSLLSEFVQYNITSTQLNAYVHSDRLPEVLKAKLKDVLVMYEGFEDFMRNRYITAEEILNVLANVAHKSEILKDSVLIFDEFTGFTPIQNKLLKTLFPIVNRVYITLTIDSKEDFYHSRGMQELFDMPKKSIASLMRIADEAGIDVLEPIVLEPCKDRRFCNSDELYYMEQNIFRRKHRISKAECKNIKVTSLQSPRDEMIYAARRINELIQKEGYRYKDIAIVSGDVNSYSNYVAEVFDKYNIPYFIDTTKEVLFHPFIEFIRAALEIIRYDFSISSVVRFLRCGFCDIEDNQIDILENYLLATGIRGKKAWKGRWLRMPGHGISYDLESLDELRCRIYDILSSVIEVFFNKESTVKMEITALYRMISGLDIEKKLWKLEEEYLSQGQQIKSKEYGQIYMIVMSLFEKFAAILGDEQMSVVEFTEILDAGVDAAEVATIPPGFDCVTIGDIERTRLNDVKILFFTGVNDGIVPKSANAGGIISQYEREVLKDMDIELAPGAREQSFIQKFYLYLNMTKPSERLYLSFHRVDKDGKAALKSYLINTISRLFAKLDIEYVEDISANLNVSTKLAAEEYLINGSQDENWYALAKWFGADEILDARYRYYEGNPISKMVAQAVYGKNIKGSVTRLERFARCQYAHYLTYGLRLREREMSGLMSVDIGNIYHEALSRYSIKIKESNEYDWRNIDDEKRDELALVSLAEAIESYPNLLAYASAKEEYILKKMQHVFKQTVWALTKQVQKGRFNPDKFEFQFEMQTSSDISLVGRIDRIDTFHDEGKDYIKVIDYKSGNTRFDLLKLYNGVSLQLAVYMNAAVGDENIPGGMLYYHIDDPVLELDENAGEDEAKEALMLKLRPDGLINSDEKVIQAFDENIEGKSLVVPVKLKKDGMPDAYSSVATREEFDIISEFTNNKIAQISEDIYDGNIKINPIVIDGTDSCRYCSFQDICGIKSKMPGIETRNIPKKDKETIYDEMNTMNARLRHSKGE